MDRFWLSKRIPNIYLNFSYKIHFLPSTVDKRSEIDGALIFNIPRVPDWFDKLRDLELIVSYRRDDNSGCCCWLKLNKGNWNIVELSDSVRIFDLTSWHDAKTN